MPHLLRAYKDNSALVGQEPYYHLRAAEQILGQSSVDDPFVDDIFISPYDCLVAFFLMIGLEGIILSRLLPFMIGMLFMFFVCLNLRRADSDNLKLVLFAVCILLSPGLIFIFSFSNALSLALLLSAIGLYCFSSPSRAVNYLSVICISVLAFFNIAYASIMLMIFFVHMIRQRRGHLVFLLSLLVSLMIFHLFSIHVYLQYNQVSMLSSASVLSQLVSDFGSFKGFGIYNLILAVIGLFVSWKDKFRYIWAYVLLFFLIFYYPSTGMDLLIPAGIIIAIFAGLGLNSLVRLDWQISKIRDLTIIIVFCGLIFSSFSLVNRVSSFYPDDDYVEASSFLSGSGVVLSHFSNAHIIGYYSGLPVLPDPLIAYGGSDADAIYHDIDTIFSSSDLDDTKRMLYKYDVKYIFIDSRMDQGLVWEKENQGLRFLFRNDETFSRVFANDGIEIWEVLDARPEWVGFELIDDES
ncbi:hypothetical protein JW968_07005 [Candidatus Woesearchaeota archaeon]|nr:hypothetical protein [Candidatus Woesearchaeota archaeon]